LKRRETKSVWEEAGRSALVRAGSRWLSFARTLTRGRHRMAAADTLAFIESLYGGRFRGIEGGAFSLDKVYRTTGRGLSVSETRLSVSVHPRFDLRLLNVAGRSRAGTHLLREAPTTTAFTLLSRAVVSGREQHGAARRVTNVDARSFQSYPTTLFQTISPFTFTLLQQRTQFGAPQTTMLLQAAPAHGVAAAPWLTTHTWNVLPATPASLPLTSLGLGRPVVHATRQEFASVLLKTYLPAVESRESLSVRPRADSPGASPRLSTAQGETERRFAPAHGVAERHTPSRTYATPTTRQQQGGAVVEIRREFREFRVAEALRERATAPHPTTPHAMAPHSTTPHATALRATAPHATAPHATTHDPWPSLVQVLPPASLLLSLSEDFLTVLAGGDGGPGRTTHELGGRAAAVSLQHLRTRTAPSSAREGAAAVHAPRLVERTAQQQAPHRTTGTRDVLSSIHTLVERVHSTFAGVTHAGYSTLFTRHGFEQMSARQRGTSSEAAPGHTTSRSLLGRPGEFVRPASFAEFTREASTRKASTRDASTPTALERTPGLFSTQGALGAGTFLFTTTLLRRSGGGATTGALLPTAATALRLAATGETEGAAREARAARPEGMALELIRHQREEVLRLPRPGYVFTQPARAQLEERQVITKASREEIVEVVRKEVRALGGASPAASAASRADLAGIAEEVYSTLVRRLLVEKERLGRV
jgi:hypothetical protein